MNAFPCTILILSILIGYLHENNATIVRDATLSNIALETVRKSNCFRSNITEFARSDILFLNNEPVTVEDVLKQLIKLDLTVVTASTEMNLKQFLQTQTSSTEWFRLMREGRLVTCKDVGQIMDKQQVSFLKPSQVNINGNSYTMANIIERYAPHSKSSISIRYKNNDEYLMYQQERVDPAKLYNIVFHRPSVVYDFTMLEVNNAKLNFYPLMYTLAFIPNLQVVIEGLKMSVLTFLDEYPSFHGKLQLEHESVPIDMSAIFKISLKYTIIDYISLPTAMVHPYYALNSLKHDNDLQAWRPGAQQSRMPLTQFIKDVFEDEDPKQNRIQLFYQNTIITIQYLIDLLNTQGRIVFGDMSLAQRLPTNGQYTILHKGHVYPIKAFLQTYERTTEYYEVLQLNRSLTMSELRKVVQYSSVKISDVQRAQSNNIDHLGVSFRPSEIANNLAIQNPRHVMIIYQGKQYTPVQFMKTYRDNLPEEFNIQQNDVDIPMDDVFKLIEFTLTPQFWRVYRVTNIPYKGQIYSKDDILRAVLNNPEGFMIMEKGQLRSPAAYKEHNGDNVPGYVLYYQDMPVKPDDIAKVVSLESILEEEFYPIIYNGYTYSPQKIVQMLDNQQPDNVIIMHREKPYTPAEYMEKFPSTKFQVLNNHYPIDAEDLESIIDFDMMSPQPEHRFANIKYKGVSYNAAQFIDVLIKQNPPNVKILHKGIFYMPKQFKRHFATLLPRNFAVVQNKRIIPSKLLPTIVRLGDSKKTYPKIFPNVFYKGKEYTPDDILLMLVTQNPPDVEIAIRNKRFTPKQFEDQYNGIYPITFSILFKNNLIDPNEIHNIVDFDAVTKPPPPRLVVQTGTVEEDDVSLMDSTVDRSLYISSQYNQSPEESSLTLPSAIEDDDVYTMGINSIPQVSAESSDITLENSSEDNSSAENSLLVQRNNRVVEYGPRTGYEKTNKKIPENAAEVGPLNDVDLNKFPYIVHEGTLYSPDDVIKSLAESNLECRVVYDNKMYTPKEFLQKYHVQIPREFKILLEGNEIRPEDISTMVLLKNHGVLVNDDPNGNIQPHLVQNGAIYTPKHILNCLVNQNSEDISILHQGRVYEPSKFENTFKDKEIPNDYQVLVNNKPVQPEDLHSVVNLDQSTPIAPTTSTNRFTKSHQLVDNDQTTELLPVVKVISIEESMFPTILHNGEVYSPEEVINLIVKEQAENVTIQHESQIYTPTEFLDTFRNEFPEDFEVLVNDKTIDPQELPTIFNFDSTVEHTTLSPTAVEGTRTASEVEFSPREKAFTEPISVETTAASPVILKQTLPDLSEDTQSFSLPSSDQSEERLEEITKVNEEIVFPNLIVEDKTFTPQDVVEVLESHHVPVEIVRQDHEYTPEEFLEAFDTTTEFPNDFEVFLNHEYVQPEEVPRIVDFSTEDTIEVSTETPLQFPYIVYNGSIYSPLEVIKSLAEQNPENVKIFSDGQDYKPIEFYNNYDNEKPSYFEIYKDNQLVKPSDIPKIIDLSTNDWDSLDYYGSDPEPFKLQLQPDKDFLDRLVEIQPENVMIEVDDAKLTPQDFKETYQGNWPKNVTILNHNATVKDLNVYIADITNNYTFPHIVNNETLYSPADIVDNLIEQNVPNVDILHVGNSYTPQQFSLDHPKDVPDNIRFVQNGQVLTPNEISRIVQLEHTRPNNSNEDGYHFPSVFKENKEYKPKDVVESLVDHNPTNVRIVRDHISYKPEEFMGNFTDPNFDQVLVNDQVVPYEYVPEVIDLVNEGVHKVPFPHEALPQILVDDKPLGPTEVVDKLVEINNPDIEIAHDGNLYTPEEIKNDFEKIPADISVIQNGLALTPVEISQCLAPTLPRQVNEGIPAVPSSNKDSSLSATDSMQFEPPEVIKYLIDENNPDVKIIYGSQEYTPEEFNKLPEVPEASFEVKVGNKVIPYEYDPRLREYITNMQRIEKSTTSTTISLTTNVHSKVDDYTSPHPIGESSASTPPALTTRKPNIPDAPPDMINQLIHDNPHTRIVINSEEYTPEEVKKNMAESANSVSEPTTEATSDQTQRTFIYNPNPVTIVRDDKSDSYDSTEASSSEQFESTEEETMKPEDIIEALVESSVPQDVRIVYESKEYEPSSFQNTFLEVPENVDVIMGGVKVPFEKIPLILRQTTTSTTHFTTENSRISTTTGSNRLVEISRPEVNDNNSDDSNSRSSPESSDEDGSVVIYPTRYTTVKSRMMEDGDFDSITTLKPTTVMEEDELSVSSDTSSEEEPGIIESSMEYSEEIDRSNNIVSSSYPQSSVNINRPTKPKHPWLSNPLPPAPVEKENNLFKPSSTPISPMPLTTERSSKTKSENRIRVVSDGPNTIIREDGPQRIVPSGEGIASKEEPLYWNSETYERPIPKSESRLNTPTGRLVVLPSSSGTDSNIDNDDTQPLESIYSDNDNSEKSPTRESTTENINHYDMPQSSEMSSSNVEGSDSIHMPQSSEIVEIPNWSDKSERSEKPGRTGTTRIPEIFERPLVPEGSDIQDWTDESVQSEIQVRDESTKRPEKSERPRIPIRGETSRIPERFERLPASERPVKIPVGAEIEMTKRPENVERLYKPERAGKPKIPEIVERPEMRGRQDIPNTLERPENPGIVLQNDKRPEIPDDISFRPESPEHVPTQWTSERTKHFETTTARESTTILNQEQFISTIQKEPIAKPTQYLVVSSVGYQPDTQSSSESGSQQAVPQDISRISQTQMSQEYPSSETATHSSVMYNSHEEPSIEQSGTSISSQPDSDFSPVSENKTEQPNLSQVSESETSTSSSISVTSSSAEHQAPLIIREGTIYDELDIIDELVINNVPNVGIICNGTSYTPNEFIQSYPGNKPLYKDIEFVNNGQPISPYELLSLIPEKHHQKSTDTFPDVISDGVLYHPKDIVKHLSDEEPACVAILYKNQLYTAQEFYQMFEKDFPSDFAVQVSGKIADPKALLTLLKLSLKDTPKESRNVKYPIDTSPSINPVEKFIRRSIAKEPNFNIVYKGINYDPEKYLQTYARYPPANFNIKFNNKVMKPKEFQKYLRQVETYQQMQNPSKFPRVRYNGKIYTGRIIVERIAEQKPSNTKIMYNGREMEPELFLQIPGNPSNFLILQNGVVVNSKKIPKLVDLELEGRAVYGRYLQDGVFPTVIFENEEYTPELVVQSLAIANPNQVKISYQNKVYSPLQLLSSFEQIPLNFHLVDANGEDINADEPSLYLKSEFGGRKSNNQTMSKFPILVYRNEQFTPMEVLKNIASQEKNIKVKLRNGGRLMNAKKVLQMNPVPEDFELVFNKAIIKPTRLAKLIKLRRDK